MTGDIRLELVAFDAADINALADFYVALAGWTIARTEDDWITLRTTEGHEVALQLAPDHAPPQWPGQEHPQQFHLDLLVDGYKEAAERAVALGATHLADGASWITLADPAGHPFDLVQRDGIEGVALYAITIDAPETSALAHFYADLLGVDVAYDGPEGAMLGGDGPGVMFQLVDGYNAPRWPDPAYPQQAHLDLLVDDLDAGEARVLELGATKLKEDSAGFRVYADPVGHPFCLTTP